MLTEESIVASYLEDEVQLTGVSITQIQDVQVGLFGTGTNVPQVSTNPNVPDEDKVLMQLMSAGLAGTYLYTDTAISELALNFTNPAQNQPITTTWGITPSIMHVLTGTYPHRDEALATTNTTTTLEMLNEHYVDCAVTASNQLTPTLALAYQETSGGKDLLNMTKQDAGVVLALSASLSNVPMATMHQTQLTTYACATGSDGQSGWQALPLASPSDQPYQSALGELSRRYPSQATQRYFSMVQQLFMVYYFGRSNIVAINGQPAIVAAASEAGFGWLIDFETYTMPDYVRKVYDLDSFFLAVDTRGTLDGMRDWSATLTLLGTGYIGGIFLVRYMIPGLLTKLFKMGRWIVNKVGGWFSKPVNPAGNVEPAPDDPELSDAVVERRRLRCAGRPEQRRVRGRGPAAAERNRRGIGDQPGLRRGRGDRRQRQHVGQGGRRGGGRRGHGDHHRHHLGLLRQQRAVGHPEERVQGPGRGCHHCRPRAVGPHANPDLYRRHRLRPADRAGNLRRDLAHLGYRHRATGTRRRNTPMRWNG